MRLPGWIRHVTQAVVVMVLLVGLDIDSGIHPKAQANMKVKLTKEQQARRPFWAGDRSDPDILLQKSCREFVQNRVVSSVQPTTVLKGLSPFATEVPWGWTGNRWKGAGVNGLYRHRHNAYALPPSLSLKFAQAIMANNPFERRESEDPYYKGTAACMPPKIGLVEVTHQQYLAGAHQATPLWPSNPRMWKDPLVTGMEPVRHAGTMERWSQEERIFFSYCVTAFPDFCEQCNPDEQRAIYDWTGDLACSERVSAALATFQKFPARSSRLARKLLADEDLMRRCEDPVRMGSAGSNQLARLTGSYLNQSVPSADPWIVHGGCDNLVEEGLFSKNGWFSKGLDDQDVTKTCLGTERVILRSFGAVGDCFYIINHLNRKHPLDRLKHGAHFLLYPGLAAACSEREFFKLKGMLELEAEDWLTIVIQELTSWDNLLMDLAMGGLTRSAKLGKAVRVGRALK